MSKKVSFSMNTGPGGGQDIIHSMVQPAVMTAAERVAQRATTISASMRSHPQSFSVHSTSIGLPNRYGGTRFYATVAGDNVNLSKSSSARELDYQALNLAVDAGRMNRLV